LAVESTRESPLTPAQIVKGLDAIARVQARQAVEALGLQDVRLPLLLPFERLRSVSLAPVVSEDDKAVVKNCLKLLAFLSGGAFSPGSGAVLTPRLVSELLPLLPTVAREMGPQLSMRLGSRVLARTIRENLLDPAYV